MAWECVEGVPPLIEGSFVYALYRAGRLIYVGRTGNIHDRLKTHRRRFAFDVAKFSACASPRELRWRERRLLFRLRPAVNKILPSLLCAEFYGASRAR